MNVRCPFDYHPTKPRKFICLECGVERKQLDDEPTPESVNRYCGRAQARAGDYVHFFASSFGFKECNGCRERRAYLNNIHRKIASGFEKLSELGRKNINAP